MGTAVLAASWHLSLLGGLVLAPLVGEGLPQTQFRTQRAALLLAYLALHPGPQTREVLITLLWPDASPDAARNSLSVALSSLRHQLEPPGTPAGAVLTADRQSIGLREGALTTDVAAFQRAERQRRAGDALALYSGPLLLGFYDDWVLLERELLAEAYSSLVQQVLPTLPATEARALRLRASHADPDRAELYQGVESSHASEALPERTPTAPAEQSPQEGVPRSLPSVPAYPTRFFGRERELGGLATQLSRARLVTLLGPGGTGKTRLLVEWLRQQSETGAEVCFVPLAERTESTSLWGALRAALRLPGQGDERERVLQALHERPVLLALDNLEHLIERAAELVVALLEAIPELRILTTSRRALGVPGEHLFPVEPLPLPVELREPAQLLKSSPSVALFCDRARAALPDFSLTPRNLPTVVALCRRLDGLPLALELTASRARVLTPGQWLERLEKGLDAVAVTARAGVPERHRSLLTALRWSYDLLPLETQAFFPLLSVFRGGWSLEAAEAVTDDPLALDQLAMLMENALVLSEETPEGMRFRMLETIREFAASLLPPEESAALAERQATFALELVEAAARGLGGAEQAPWLARLERDHENLNLALESSLQREDPEGNERALAIAARLTLFWELRGHFDEGRRFQARVREAIGEGGNPTRRAELLGGSWSLALCQGDFPAARELAAQELALRRSIGEPLGIARALHRQAGTELRQGRYESAVTFLEESIALKKAHDAPPRELALSLINLGVIANEQGDCGQGARYLEECLIHTRREGIQNLTAMTLNNLGMSYEYQGEQEKALACFKESLTIKEALGDKRGTAVTLQNAARISRLRGDFEEARSQLLQSLRLLWELGDAPNGVITLHGLGVLEATLGKPLSAARLWGCWEATYEAHQIPLTPADREQTEAQFQETRAACPDPAAFDAAWQGGRQIAWKTLAAELLGQS